MPEPTEPHVSTWTPDLPADASPLYAAIADALARDLRAGRLEVGARLPTHRELARRLGVNVVTVTRGYAEAARRGLVEGTVGRGTFVRDNGHCASPFMPLLPDEATPRDLGFNLPVCEPELLRIPELLAGLAEHPERVPLVAPYTATGIESHREVAAAWLERSGVEVDVSRTMVCGGAQHALAVSLASLTSPDDVLLADELTYPGLNALASVLHLRVVGVPSDESGMLPSSLEDAIHLHKARVVFLMPNLHNPTGVTMPQRRRQELADVARRNDLRVIEDDTYGFLLSAPPAPIASLLPEATYFLTSLSKSLTAGLRVGYLALPQDGQGSESVLRRVSANVAAITWAAAPLMGELASRLIQSGAAQAQVEWKRAEMRARRALFETRLPQLRTRSAACSAHVWVPLPLGWDAEVFASTARERSVHLNAASSFTTSRNRTQRGVRLCLGSPATREFLSDALERLGQVLAAGPRASAQVG
ncbi:MAG: transcriptional regulator [Planctomycetota bacterium]|nr:MAG: transcriptional regulator [Planctomycetota bacterium]